jgi:prophage antirepressor-like protein
MYSKYITMSGIIKQFTQGTSTLNVYGTFDKPLFLANEVGVFLGLKSCRSSLRHVNPLWKHVQPMPTLGGVQQMTFLSESGLYKLIMRSDKEEAVKFQEWICEDVLPAIRKTGQYKMQEHKPFEQLTFKIENEMDLNTKVVNFIKNTYPDSLISAGLGELQDTSQKRIKSAKMGYKSGEPDLKINNLHKDYTGFVIEFKNPNGLGKLSANQSKMLTKYKRNSFKVLVSNNYDECILEIHEYMKNTRIQCQYCSGKFKNNNTLQNHLSGFHRIE